MNVRKVINRGCKPPLKPIVMETINIDGVTLTRNKQLEQRIKRQRKNHNSECHPNERLTFSEYMNCYHRYLTFKGTKIYTK